MSCWIRSIFQLVFMYLYVCMWFYFKQPNVSLCSIECVSEVEGRTKFHIVFVLITWCEGNDFWCCSQSFLKKGRID